MTRIQLQIEIVPYPLFSDQEGTEISFQKTRLKVHAIFLEKDKKSVSPPYMGIIATGSRTSVLPHFIWRNLHRKVYGEFILQ